MTPDAIQIIKTEPVKSWVTRQELEDAIQVTKTDDDGYPLEARVRSVIDQDFRDALLKEWAMGMARVVARRIESDPSFADRLREVYGKNNS